MRLILASASPRRAELLRAAGIPFEVSSVQIDERFRNAEAPETAVARLARSKAEAVAGLHKDAVVLAADTTVVVGGETLGKPVNAADSSRMLRLLSGRAHEVLTGVCLCSDSRALVYVERTVVRVAQLSDEDIAWYVATGEPHDKAGAYAIQGLGSRFIEAIEGSYSNVVGLPISSVYERLKDLGCDILGSTKTL
jgi:nucleoside triphosphate pyrophosphatase